MSRRSDAGSSEVAGSVASPYGNGRRTPRAGQNGAAHPSHSVDLTPSGGSTSPIDEVDVALIEQLKVDGRATIRSLAKVLGIGEPTVRARMRRLAETRTVRVVAVADIEALGHQFMLHGRVKVAGRPVQEVVNELAAIPEVIHLVSTLGQFDLLFTTLVRDQVHLNDVVARQFRSIDGVDSIRWELALDTLVFRSDWGAFGDNHLPVEPRAPTERVDEVDLAIIHLLGEDAR